MKASPRLPAASLTRTLLVTALAVQLVAGQAVTAFAQKSVPVVRDAEIESYVARIARPILKAAGLGKAGVDVILVNNDSFNAFVDGRRIFINTGTLMTAETPNEVAGVIAHETGHLAGGHQERLRQQLQRAKTMAIVAALAGIGAGVAGSAANVKGLGQAGMGIAMGGSQMARRGLLSYQRTEEITADRAALEYLKATGRSAKGMLDTFKRFQGSMALAGVNVNPYELSHPMPRERIANLEEQARKSPYFDRKDPPELQRRHDLARAKIAAYTQGPAAVARLFRDDPRGLSARYGDAISTYLHGRPRDAVAKADRLIEENPDYPYFHELRGDALINANRPAEAAKAYARAVRLDSANTGLLRVAYGRALLATGKPDDVRKAARELKAGLSRAPEFANGYEFLAQAYGRMNEIGAADLATAEGRFHSGNYEEAKIFAARARKRLSRGSPEWLRAQDIINYEPVGQK